jgi:glucokinase
LTSVRESPSFRPSAQHHFNRLSTISPEKERDPDDRSVRGMSTVLAVDVGGTKLAAALVDHHGVISGAVRAPTVPEAGAPDGGGAEALFRRLMGLVDRVRSGSSPGDGADGVDGVAGCGVGCGGPMEPGGTAVSPLHIPAWRGFPLRERLARELALPVFVDNDAKAIALAEGWRGAARGQRNFLAMVVSTGIGGGLVLDGRLVEGGHGNAGHIGHVIVEPSGRPCRCGATGCLEAEASGTAIAAHTGRPAEEADAITVERTGRMVGRAVASAANLLDLRLVCVAGSVALGFGAPFFAAANAELDRSARLPFVRGARIVPAGLGPDAPLVGAGAIAHRALGADVGIG